MEQDTTPKPDQPAAPILEEEHTALDLLRAHGSSIIGGVVLAVAIFLGFTWFRQRSDTQREAAAQLFATAQSAAQLQEVLNRYPQAPIAPLALLGLASERFHEGNAELAASHYRQFITQHGQHPMRPAAELGLIYSDEALGRVEEALAAYQRFANQHADHYLFAPAQLGQARLLTQAGRFDEAAAIYDALIEDPDQRWQGQASADKSYMEKRRRALP
jgi:predicted negative regulator of RcsB-dependent stress response